MIPEATGGFRCSDGTVCAENRTENGVFFNGGRPKLLCQNLMPNLPDSREFSLHGSLKQKDSESLECPESAEFQLRCFGKGSLHRPLCLSSSSFAPHFSGLPLAQLLCPRPFHVPADAKAGGLGTKLGAKHTHLA